MPLHLSIVVSDAHAPGAPLADMRSDCTEVLEPLLGLLERRPAFRVGLHLSNTMLSHLETDAAELIPRLQALTKKKRITFLCSPAQGALPWLGPEREAVAQLKQHKARLEELFGAPVRGLLPPALAWNPIYARLASRIGVRFALVPDAILMAGGATAPVRGWVRVRSGAHRTQALPVDTRLLQLVPHGGAAQVVQELLFRVEEGVQATVLMLPMARLSSWGGKPCGAFLGTLAARLARQGGWAKLVAPHLLLERTEAAGHAHPPSATTAHVGVGMLDAKQGRRLWEVADAHLHRVDRVLATQVPGLVGAPIDAAVSAWAPAGRLVDRAAQVSTAVAGLRRAAGRHKQLSGLVHKAASALNRGRSSAALFDGDGGHVGEPSVRHAAWKALMDAEAVLWKAKGAAASAEVDHSEDGGPISLRTAFFVASVTPSGGAICELGLRGVGNLVNTYTPRERPWSHRLGDPALPVLIDEGDLASFDDGDDVDEPTDDPTDPPTDPGESEVTLVPSEVPAVPGMLPPPPATPADPEALGLPIYPRPFLLGQDLLLAAGSTTEAIARGMHREQGDFADGEWRVERAEVDGADVVVLLAREGTVRDWDGSTGMVHLSKTLRFSGTEPKVELSWTAVNRSRETVRTRLGVVLPLNVDGALGPMRTLHIPGSLPRPQDATGRVDDIADFALRYGELGLLVRARPGRPVRVDHFPLTAPVRRRGGYAAVHQGTVAVLSWPLELWGEEWRTETMVLEVHQR